MISPLTPKEFQDFKNLLVKTCGIVLKDSQEYLIETRLTEFVYEIGVHSFGELYEKVTKDNRLIPRIIDLMTTNETQWFRDKSCWNTLEYLVIPSFIEKLKKGSPSIRIWSAAASTGQEAYSLSILIDEILSKQNMTSFSSKLQIVGTDISKAAIFLANRAKYDQFSINRGMSPERVSKYFFIENNTYLLKPQIKQRVEFRQFNLLDRFQTLGKFDLILCRNVAIYFSPEFKKELFDKLSNVLKPDGLLLLGATESLFGIQTPFETLSFRNGLYYKIKKV